MDYTTINRYIPSSLYPLKATHPMTPEYITIHNTANDAPAINEISYMTRNSSSVSFHVAIDDIHAIQAIPFDRNAWHAGDGQGKGNRASIGIEICYSKSDGERYRKAEANAIDYIARLLKHFGWGIDRVKWHSDWSGKKCPHRIIDEGRSQLVKMRIATRLVELNSSQILNTSTKGEVRMFTPSSATLKNAFEQFLSDAVKDGKIIEKWLTDFQAGKLSLDDALALKVIIDQRSE